MVFKYRLDVLRTIEKQKIITIGAPYLNSLFLVIVIYNFDISL